MRYEVTTSWTPEEVIEYAIDFFGPGRTGLQMTSQTSQGVIFQGGGGYVAIQMHPAANTTVDIETREWDYPVHQFMARIGRRRWRFNWWRRRAKVKSPEKPMFTILNNQNPNQPPASGASD